MTQDVEAVPQNQVSASPATLSVVPSSLNTTFRSRIDAGKGNRGANDGSINWLTSGIMILFHLGALAALFFFSWTNFIVAAVLYIVTLNAGVCVGYHRLLTHRGFRTPKWMEYTLTALGTLALQGGPVFWVASHRSHHQHSDHEGDPHSPQHGTWWSHAGWILTGQTLHADTAMQGRYAPDLCKDPVHVWFSKYHWVPLTASAPILFGAGWAISGWHGAVGLMLWGVFLRTTLSLHASWLVNSATHLWGRRRFETNDGSHNNWWVALLTGGEGWHNNHHAHPVSARHGLAWYEFDPNYYFIWLLEKVGLAKKVHTASFDRANPRPAGSR
jgi:stearoyl-CoA desaturase (delta-9 desaturase)